MIGYVTLGTNDLQRAAAFYDALFAEIGAGRFMESERLIAWAVAPGKPALGVCIPYDGNPATMGNGTMVALVVDSNEKVDAVYRKAISLGAKDEGAAGPRGGVRILCRVFPRPGRQQAEHLLLDAGLTRGPPASGLQSPHRGRQAKITLQQVTAPSAFSISDTSTASTRKPAASSRSRVRGPEAACTTAFRCRRVRRVRLPWRRGDEAHAWPCSAIHPVVVDQQRIGADQRNGALEVQAALSWTGTTW